MNFDHFIGNLTAALNDDVNERTEIGNRDLHSALFLDPGRHSNQSELLQQCAHIDHRKYIDRHNRLLAIDFFVDNLFFFKGVGYTKPRARARPNIKRIIKRSPKERKYKI